MSIPLLSKNDRKFSCYLWLVTISPSNFLVWEEDVMCSLISFDLYYLEVLFFFFFFFWWHFSLLNTAISFVFPTIIILIINILLMWNYYFLEVCYLSTGEHSHFFWCLFFMLHECHFSTQNCFKIINYKIFWFFSNLPCEDKKSHSFN